MEHIKKILEARKATLFAARTQKGSREWNAFNSVRGDRIDMFPVETLRAREMSYYAKLARTQRARQLTLRFAR